MTGTVGRRTFLGCLGVGALGAAAPACRTGRVVGDDDGADPGPPVAPVDALHVSVDGDDGDHGTRERPWRTLGAAISRARPGDTIIVLPGQYEEATIVETAGTREAPIVVRGEGMVLFKGSDRIQFGLDLRAPAAHWVFENLQFSRFLRNGVRVRDGKQLTFRNIACFENGTEGMLFGGLSGGGTEDVLLERCRFYRNGRSGSNGTGFKAGHKHIDIARGITLVDCVSHGNGASADGAFENASGFNFSGQTADQARESGVAPHPSDIRLVRCAAYNNGSSGITFRNGYRVSLEQCVVFDSNRVGTAAGDGYGIRFDFGGADFRALRCVVFNCRAAGVQVNGASNMGAVIEHCVFHGNHDGIIASAPTLARNNICVANTARDFRGGGATGSHHNFVGDGGWPTGTQEPGSIRGSDPGFVSAPGSGDDLGGVYANDDLPFADLWASLEDHFRLTAESPCRDAGTPIETSGVPARGSAPDMGVFES